MHEPLRPLDEPPLLERAEAALDGWFLVYVRDPTLLPVTIALFAHVSLMISGLLIAMWRTGSATATIGLAVVCAITAVLWLVEVRRVGFGGRTTWLLVGTWAAGATFGVYAHRTGLL